MVSLTESSARKIEALQKESGDASKRLRIFVEPGGCSGLEYAMSFDVQKEGDEILESEGVSFLMDAPSLAYLDGSIVDFDDGLQGKGFEIKNPNAKTTCGCGRSFS